ncbi:hypothetical protein ISS03_05035 [Patescibacteria group bacterium]|nr:hypothetical protein [Patescibacteria group bacterium]
MKKIVANWPYVVLSLVMSVVFYNLFTMFAPEDKYNVSYQPIIITKSYSLPTAIINFKIPDVSAYVDNESGEVGEEDIQKGKVNWNKLTQAQRNRRVYAFAKADLGKYIGDKRNCKTWVQVKVVPKASGGIAEVPLTWPNAYGWRWYQSPFARELKGRIKDAVQGQIVQMNYFRSEDEVTPHTAIIASNSESEVCFIENVPRISRNYDTYYVREKCYDHDWFNSVTQNRYVVYEITAGHIDNRRETLASTLGDLKAPITDQ